MGAARLDAYGVVVVVVVVAWEARLDFAMGGKWEWESRRWLTGELRLRCGVGWLVGWLVGWDGMRWEWEW